MPEPTNGIEVSVGIADLIRMDDVMPFESGFPPRLGTDGFPDDGVGLGIETILFRQWPGGFRLGAGGRLARQPFPLPEAGVELSPEGDALWSWGVFVEPRFVLRTASRVRPFIAARVGYASLHADPIARDSVEDFRSEQLVERRHGAVLDASGWEVGWSAGLVAWLREGVAIQVSGLLSSLYFTNARGEVFVETDNVGLFQDVGFREAVFREGPANGVYVGVRVGVVYPIP